MERRPEGGTLCFGVRVSSSICRVSGPNATDAWSATGILRHALCGADKRKLILRDYPAA